MKKRGSGRETILNLACEEFSQKGIRASSLNDILRQSGLSKGAFYHHFKSKEDIVLAVIEERLSSWVQLTWIKPLKKHRKLNELVRQIGKFNSGGSLPQRRQKERLFLTLIFESPYLEQRVQSSFQILFSNLLNSFNKFLKPEFSGAARDMSWLFISNLVGSQLLSLVKKSRLDYQRSLHQIKQILIIHSATSNLGVQSQVFDTKRLGENL